MKKITLFVVALLCVVAGWAQETVTVPESATVEDYTLSYTDIDYNDNQTNYTDQCKVAFDGNDIYLSGLGFSADIWVKGTLNGSTLTVAKMQLAGKANNKNYYLAGRTSEHGGLEDIVFTYIEESGVLYCEHEILAVDANDYVGGRMMNVIYTPGTSQGSVDGLPEGAQVYNYTFRLTEVTDQNMEDLTQTQTSDYTGRVAFYGQDVYVQGLGYQETSWIKGTLSGETITFPSRQVGGSYGGQDLYLIGYNGQETSIVFHYDEATGTMTLGDMYVFLINGSDNVLGAVTYAVLFRQGGEAPIEDEVVTPPANINPQPYIFKGKKMLYDQDGAYQGTEDAAWNIKVAWSGANEVYVQGLCSAMPEAWVKGTVDDDEVTFAKGQYFGKQLYPFYFSGQFVGEMSDFITIYDASTRVFSGGGYYMMINSSKTAIAPYEVYAGVTFTPGEMSATPMAPQVASFKQHDEGFDGNGSLQMMIMPYDEQYNALPTDKVFFEVIKKYADREELLVFTKADYPNIQQEMTMVPYGYTENWSLLFEDGRYGIELFNVDYPTIGVRTVFTGGGEENRSATTWLDCEDFVPVEQDPTAIAQHPSTLTQQPTYTDVQGRTVAPNAKGLVIKTVTLADGTRKSMKFMQR